MGNRENSGSPRSDTIRKTDQEIWDYFGQETERELRMEMEGSVYTLVRIGSEDEQNIRAFAPYCHGSPVGKYGVVWSTPCLKDFYVFDTREYAVDFIVMSRRVDG